MLDWVGLLKIRHLISCYYLTVVTSTFYSAHRGRTYRACGIRSALVDARKVMITDAQHGKAIPQADEIAHRARNLVRPLLDDAQVPVMGGFIGATEQGVQTTIGRGGWIFPPP